MLSSTASPPSSPVDIAQLLARQALLEQAQRERDERIAQLIDAQQTYQQAHQAREQRIHLLTEENRWLKQQLYGRSSERRVVEEVPAQQQRLIFNEAEAIAAIVPTPEASIRIPAYERKKKGRKPLPTDLPRVEIIHELSDAEKACANAACTAYGVPMKRIGEESSEQLDYIPAKVRVLKHIRLKYACPCCAQGVKVARAAPQVLPKSHASPSLLAHMVTAKYVDGTPLYRQEAQFKRLGIELPRATSATWIMKLGEAVVPLINLMQERLMTQPLIHMDETPLQVLKSDKAPTTLHYLWAQAAGPPGQRLVLFDYDPSRGAAVPRRLLQDYRGILLTDGYEAYEAALVGTPITHAGCWAHVRRKFDDAMKATPTKDSHAKTALDVIGQLYGVERQLKQRREQCEQRGELRSADDVLALRAQHSAVIIEQLKSWLDTHADQVLPQGALGKAIHYTLNQWPKLIRFLNHAELPLDNNRCENAIRPFVIGRKNWLFCDTSQGAIASARLYSLIETAKANGVEPHAYLTRLFTELPKATCVADVEALLPFKINAAAHSP